jgi:hypothetical protein
VSLTAHAIDEVGPVCADVQEYLSAVEYPGATGTIAFDEPGNRRGPISMQSPPLMEPTSEATHM